MTGEPDPEVVARRRFLDAEAKLAREIDAWREYLRERERLGISTIVVGADGSRPAVGLEVGTEADGAVVWYPLTWSGVRAAWATRSALRRCGRPIRWRYRRRR